MPGWLRRGRQNGALLGAPTVIWLLLFFVLPLVVVVVVSFMSRGRGGVAQMPLTLTHYERTFGIFSIILWRSIGLAGLTMLICLLLGYPLAFFISTRRSRLAQQIALFLVILPFWTNFLIRTYAWRILLGDEGTINSALLAMGLIDEPLRLLNTQFAVLVGLVYGFLPFMVLPIYASVERFNFRYVDAAHDLGANDIRAFTRVVLPLTLPGVLAGCALVFIPSVGAFVTPDLLGGTKGLMIGNLINNQFGGSGNMPLGSALSIVMMGVVDAVAAGLCLRQSARAGGVTVAGRESLLINEGAMARNQATRRLGRLGLWLNPLCCYFFLWAPILILVLFSFNQSRSVATFTGFTFKWYNNILNNVMGAESAFSTEIMLDAFRNSLFVGLSATAVATVLGTMIALSMARGSYPGKRLLDALLFFPVVIPEITQAISLAIFFKVAFDWYGLITGRAHGAGLPHDHHRPHHLQHLVCRDCGAGAAGGYEPAAGRSGERSGREPVADFLARDFSADLAGAWWRARCWLSRCRWTTSSSHFSPAASAHPRCRSFVYGLLKLTVTPEVKRHIDNHDAIEYGIDWHIAGQCRGGKRPRQ